MATYASIRYKVGTDRTGTIPTAAIADDAITAAKIADNAVVTAAINADAVTDAKIADDVVGTEHLTAGEVDTTALGADAVTAAKIADDVINSEHYAAGSIDNEHIADDAIDSEHYADGSIDNAHIADDAIDSEHYVDGSIDRAHLAADIIDGTKIADDVLNSEHYVAASIDNEHLADDAVGVAELSASGTASSSTFLRGDNAWASPGGGLVGRAAGTIGGNLSHSGYGPYVNHTGTFSSPSGATGGVVHASWISSNSLGMAYLKSVTGGTASSTDRNFTGTPQDVDNQRLGFGRGMHQDSLFFACGSSESLTLTFSMTRGQTGSGGTCVQNFQFSVLFV